MTRTRPGLLRTRSRDPRKKLAAQLDALWSHLVKHRSGNKCQRCLSIVAVQAHHIIERRYTATRWDLRNGIALCLNCHSRVHAKVVQIVPPHDLLMQALPITPRTMDFMEQAWVGLQLHAKAMGAKR